MVNLFSIRKLFPMAKVTGVLKQLMQQRDRTAAQLRRLDQVIGTLTGIDGGGQRRRTRRNLSAAARKRIADAQRKRWAAFRAKRGN